MSKLNLPLKLDVESLEIVDSLDNRICDVDSVQMGETLVELLNSYQGSLILKD